MGETILVWSRITEPNNFWADSDYKFLELSDYHFGSDLIFYDLWFCYSTSDFFHLNFQDFDSFF